MSQKILTPPPPLPLLLWDVSPPLPDVSYFLNGDVDCSSYLTLVRVLSWLQKFYQVRNPTATKTEVLTV